MLRIPAGAPADRTRSGRLSGFLNQTLHRARAAAVPYKIGDVIVGDDPFNGRHEGTVVVKDGHWIGLRSNGRTYFYDYRQLRRPD